MPRSFVTDARRDRIVEPWTLLIMVAVLAAVLVYAFPGRLAVQRSDYKASGDAISLAYLRVLARSYPDDRTVVLNYVRELLAAGRIDTADRWLRPWIEPLDTAPTPALVLAAEITAQRLFERLSPPSERARLRRILQRRLRVLQDRGLDRSSARRLAAMARAVGEYAVAGRLYATAATAGVDLDEPLLRASAQAYASAGDWPNAAAQYRRLSEAADDGDARAAADELLTSWLAGGRPDRALQAARAMLERWPRDAALLERAVTIAQFADRIEVALALAERRIALAEPNPDPALLRQHYRLARAADQRATAAATLERLLALGVVTPTERADLARLLEATGRPRAALEQWRWLERRHPDLTADAGVVGTAVAVYAYDVAIEILLLRGARRSLEPDELDALVAATREAGEGARVRARLRGWLADEPDRIGYWDAYIALLRDDGDPEALARAYRRYSKRFPVGTRARMDWARELMARGRFDAALSVLVPPGPPRPAGDAFWQLRARVAWQAEALDAALEAYAQLAAARALAPDTASRFVRLARRRGDHGWAARAALAGAEQTGQPGLVALGLESALVAGDETLARRLLALGERIAAGDARFWVQVAAYRRRQGETDRALAAHRRALSLAPDDPSIRSAHLWLLLDLDRTDQALARARAWSGEAADADLGAALAVVFARAGAHRAALAWFARTAPARSQDWPWLLSYADALDAAGRSEAALRLRRYVLEHVITADGPDEPRAMLRAGQGTLSDAARWRLIRTGRERDGATAFWYEALAEWYLAREHVDGARAVLAQAHARRLQRPAWQRLSVALQTGDTAAVGRLLADGELDDPGNRAAALERVGRKSEAMAVTAAAVDDSTSGTREQAAALASERPYGYRGWLARETVGGVALDGAGARLAVPGRLGQFTLDAERWRHRREGAIVADRVGDEAVMRVSGEISAGPGEVDLGLSRRRRGDADLTAGWLGWRQRDPRRWRWSARAGVAEAPSLTGPLRLFGRRDTVGLGLDVNWSRRLFASADLAWRRYSARADGAAIGEGVATSVTVGERLRLGNPEWTLRAQWDWQSYRRSDKLPASVADGLVAGADIDDVLIARSSTAVVASRWARGRAGRLHGRAKRPRYSLELALGWRTPQAEPVARVDAAWGWPVTGSDEIAVRGGVERGGDALAGDTSVSLELDYTYWLGRQ